MHMDLAAVQRANGRLAEAEKSYRQAFRLFGTLRVAKGDLGPEGIVVSGLARCELAAGRVKEAEDLYRRALKISPGRSDVRIAWAWFLATCREADRRDPGGAIRLMKAMVPPHIPGEARITNPHASVVLGVAQYRAGDWKTAVATLGGFAQARDGRENGAGFFLAMAHWQLGEKDKAWQLYEEARAWTDKYRPKDKELLRFHAEAARLLGLEQIEFAQRCSVKDRFVAAVRHFSAAFAAEPKLAEDLSRAHRIVAAVAAALAGCGQGEDAAPLDKNERARLRQQALDWLRADLALWVKKLEDFPLFAERVRQEMENWQGNTCFAGVRDRVALAKLPQAERAAWRKFWGEVAATRAKAQGQSPAQGKGKKTP
jgi:tetratricopeptide (TPR) repeat protein